MFFSLSIQEAEKIRKIFEMQLRRHTRTGSHDVLFPYPYSTLSLPSSFSSSLYLFLFPSMRRRQPVKAMSDTFWTASQGIRRQTGEACEDPDRETARRKFAKRSDGIASHRDKKRRESNLANGWLTYQSKYRAKLSAIMWFRITLRPFKIGQRT